MFKFLLKFSIVVGVLIGIGALVVPPISRAVAEANKPRWRTEPVTQGEITKFVNATGTVKPTKSVQVGSFVSGPITDLFVEFNEEVKQGQLLAKIDPRLFAADVARDMASLATRKAELERVKALYQQAVNDEGRALALKKQNKDFIAQTELDQVKFNRMSLKAQLTIAESSIKQAEATLSNSEANLDYCEIKSPEDGMIIDRKVDPGQTLAAQFQTPELFIVGVGMREKMHIFADVDESEIGLIRDAADAKQPVTFSVTAYPDISFQGLIEEVRFSSAETQNVVTYPVVVGSPNPELKLLPGMKADLSFQVRKIENVIRIPKAALRFYPPDKLYVHPDDHHIIEGTDFSAPAASSDDEEEAEVNSTPEERADASKKSKTRHVWKIDGELLRAVEVEIGLTDNQYAELISGELDDNSVLVVGQKARGEQ